MSREGSLEAPTRHPIAWRDAAFYDAEALDKELRRVFDICHGCRRCFKPVRSFPRLFDLIDNSADETIEAVKSEDFVDVVEACTLCDMCFMTKCPYVPPHEFQLDFSASDPARPRAVEAKQGKSDFTQRHWPRWTATARSRASPRRSSTGRRPPSRCAPHWKRSRISTARRSLPKFHTRTFVSADKGDPIQANCGGAGLRQAQGGALCHLLRQLQQAGDGARRAAVLNHIGVETKVAYPGCCGMPFLEQAELDRVAKNAAKVSKELVKLIDEAMTSWRSPRAAG